MDDRAGQDRKNRKTRDRAFIVLIMGIVLLMPPLAGIFQIDARILGLPATLVYLFLVWAGLILATSMLARALMRSDTPPES
ncbi:MAG: hypothetical protein AAF557_12230 [Pseudomonadota bacterium]